MDNIFSKIKLDKLPRNKFDHTHDVKMSGKMGYLYPCCVLEALPGDRFSIGADVMTRFAPMLAPVMHRIDLFIHYFYVPNRIIWDGFEEFIVGQERVAPYITLDDDSAAPGTDFQKFIDYMGIPPFEGDQPIPVNALPFAAYNMIYNEYYRDQNLCPEVDFELEDGLNDYTKFKLRRRAWHHDYFTAALPFAQKGTPVDIPLGDVRLKEFVSEPAQKPIFSDWSGDVDNGNLQQTSNEIRIDGVGPARFYDPAGSLTVTPTTINDLRTAFALQEWLELNARGGTRYTENTYTMFGIKSPDARLQRPEYITGIKAPVVISEVLNNTGPQYVYDSENSQIVETPSSVPQGDMAGHGVAVSQGRYGSYFSYEHGYIIGILSVMPRTAYQQGVPRHFLKESFLDYYWKSFAHIGEQEIDINELYYGYHPKGTKTFGYTPRYAEYKYTPSRVAGDFRTSLNFWHCAMIFDNEPALNQEFIEMNYQMVDRIFAVKDGTDNIWMHVLNKITASRLMPYFGNPAGIVS